MSFSFLAAARPPLARTGKSKLEPQSKLHNARRAARRGRSDVAESAVAIVQVGKAEARRVREVEELAAKLELHLFADREFLGEREIDVVDAVGTQVREVARRVAGSLVAGIGKAGGVEERGVAGTVEEVGRSLVVADAAGNLRADD